MDHKQRNDALRKRSGTVRIRGKLVDFLYTLLRDHLPVGKVEELVREAEDDFDRSPEEANTYTNGWLAQYAQDLANRLEETPKLQPGDLCTYLLEPEVKARVVSIGAALLHEKDQALLEDMDGRNLRWVSTKLWEKIA